MTSDPVVSFVFLKALTTVALIICVYIKQNIMMSVYWMFLFASPFIAYSSKSTTKKSISIYAILLFSTSLIMLILLILFQFIPAPHKLSADEETTGTTVERVAQSIGFIALKKLHSPYEIFLYTFPDIFIFAWALLNILVVGIHLPINKSFNTDRDKFLKYKYIVLLALGLTGAMFPSCIHMVYFLVFITFMTLASFGLTIDRCFGYFCRVLAVFVIAHCLIIFFYQMNWLQSLLPKETRTARAYGLKSWKSLDINKYGLVFSNFEFFSHIQLPILVLLYYLLVYQSHITFTKSQSNEGSKADSTHKEDKLNKSQSNEVSKADSTQKEDNFMSSLKAFLFPGPQYYLQTFYLATNASMMLWSVLYRHWMSLILLLWVSLMWVFNRKKFMTCYSRSLVLYAILLLIIQYVYCMDFTDEELPSDLNEIGFNKQRGDSVPIITKSLFTLVFWMNLYIVTSAKHKPNVQDSDMPKLPFHKTREFIRNTLSQIWFALIIILLFLIGLVGHYMHLSRILCTLFALLFCASMQNYTTYSHSLRLRYFLCVTLIVCSMFLLTLVYTYQFKTIAQFWDKMIPDKIKHVMGIASLKADMFTSVTKLTFVVITVSVYVNVLHKSTATEPFAILQSVVQLDTSIIVIQNERKENFVYRLHLTLSFVVQYLHIHKLDFIWLTIGLCIPHSGSGLMLFSVIGLCLPIKGQIFIIRFISILLSGFIFLFVLYQLPSSTVVDNLTTRVQESQDNDILQVIGFFKTTNVFSKLIVYVLIISMITCCENLNHVKHPYSLFPNVTYFDTDDSILSSLKYLANYGFYRFSLEVCYISMLFSIVSHPDVLTIVLLLWLSLFISMKRSHVNKIWKVFIGYQLPMIPLHYSGLMKDGPFFKQYYFVLLFLSMKHLRIIQLESKLLHQNRVFAGGNNTPLTDYESTGMNNTRNFYEHMHSSLDIIKSYIFGTFLWMTLTFVFVVYKGQPYIFSLGYMTSVFLLLWLGNEFYLKSQKQILKYINLLIYYTIAVMLMKMTLLVTHSNNIQFNELFCDYIEYFVPIVFKHTEKTYGSKKNILSCQIDKTKIDLFWDAACLVVFLFQKRIFRSNYFLHVVMETQYNASRASRGLKVMFEKEQKHYKQYKEQNRLTYEKLKKSIAKQDASQTSPYVPQYHHEAMRAGDYYMFPNNEMIPITNVSSTNQNSRKNPEITEPITDSETKKIVWWRHVMSFVEKLLKIIINWLNNHSISYKKMKIAYQKDKEEYYKNIKKINGYSNLKNNKEDKNVIELTFVEDSASFREEKVLRPSEKDDKVMSKETKLILQLYFSAYYAIISNSTVVTYVVIILHQATTASLLTLPISLLLFLWGSLTVPRPSVNFWILLIVYVEIMIAIKFIFSFDNIKWNNVDTHEAFLPPKFVGVWKSEQVSSMDIILLLTLFHHRYVFKLWGLWAQSISPESNKKLILIESSNTLTNCWQALKMYLKPPTEFLKSVFKLKRKNMKKDVNFYLFLCDFLIFVILFAKFDSFVPPEEATYVSEYFKTKQKSRFNIYYVMCLITQFSLILIDRVLYLRKFLKGKIVFDVIQIVIFHVLIFFIHPIYTNRYFKESLFPQLVYIIKSSYFAISSYIIRHGYPKIMVGIMFQEDAGIINKYVYRVYFLIPFLHEMRTIMDWMWTDTSMTLSEWFRFEDIHAQLYVLRCDLNYDDANPAPRGDKYPLSLKYLYGFSILLLIFLCIWSPILLFTDYGFKETIVPDLPDEFKIMIRLGTYPPMYTQAIHKSQLIQISDGTYNILKQQYVNSTMARKVFKVFKPNLTFIAQLDPQSPWQLSPEQIVKLEKQLQCNNSSKECKLQMTLTVEMLKNTYTVIDSHSIVLSNENKANLIQALFGSGNNTVQIRNLYPKFMQSSPGNVFLLDLMSSDSNVSPEQNYFDVNVTMKFYPENSSLINASQTWTTVHTDYSHMQMKKVFDKVPCLASQDPVNIIIFNHEDDSTPNEGIISAVLSKLRTKGLLWIYSSYILVLSLRVLRKILTRSVESIIVQELPYVDRVWELCSQIYIAREMKDLVLEEDLYARLLFVFRSPATLIKLSRPPARPNTI